MNWRMAGRFLAANVMGYVVALMSFLVLVSDALERVPTPFWEHAVAIVFTGLIVWLPLGTFRAAALHPKVPFGSWVGATVLGGIGGALLMASVQHLLGFPEQSPFVGNGKPVALALLAHLAASGGVGIAQAVLLRHVTHRVGAGAPFTICMVWFPLPLSPNRTCDFRRIRLSIGSRSTVAVRGMVAIPADRDE
ncbi:MAG TPA: hypothetical protein VGW38_00880 [Chloroflexota bacterium]|nr:hypothetical protein [Chloroflexota bacterium]